MIQFVNLNWDSDFFGFKVAKLTDFEPTELKDVLSSLAGLGYRLAVLFSALQDEPVRKAAGENRGLLVDRKVTYGRPVPEVAAGNPPGPGLNGHIKVNPFGLEPEALFELAYLAGSYSRFRTDRNFPEDAFKKLYNQWVINSMNGEIADHNLVYYAGNEIGGYSTLKTGGETGRIGLISVDPSRQGQGIGRALMDETYRICNTHGIGKLEVVTQMENTQACRFYEKTGFTVKEVKYIYHFWLG